MGACPWVRKILIARALCRKSDLRPTSKTGVFGQKCRTSGYHWSKMSDEPRSG